MSNFSIDQNVFEIPVEYQGGITEIITEPIIPCDLYSSPGNSRNFGIVPRSVNLQNNFVTDPEFLNDMIVQQSMQCPVPVIEINQDRALDHCQSPPSLENIQPSKLCPVTSTRAKTKYSSYQLVNLEHEFLKNQYLRQPKRINLALDLNLTEKQVKVWFQNRRVKYRKQSKIDKPGPNGSRSSPSHSSGSESGYVSITRDKAECHDIAQHLFSQSVVAHSKYGTLSTAGFPYIHQYPLPDEMYKPAQQIFHHPSAYGDQLGLQAQIRE